MIETGLTTSASSIPSLRRLADRANIHPATLSRIIRGQYVNPPSDQHIGRIADALEQSPSTIRGWLNLDPVVPRDGGEGDYVPPEGSASLTAGQRGAVDRVISAFIEANRGRRPARRALGSRLVEGLARETGMTQAAAADMLERIDTHASSVQQSS
jgi:transcriptional regulator with XRE-family HTH domain